MPLTTVTASIATFQITGAALPFAKVRFELTAPDVQTSVGIIAPDPATVTMDEAGEGTIALWPNALGTQGTQYRVQIEDQSGRAQFSGLATVPNSNCNLHDVLNLEAPASVDDAEAAALAAQGYAADASASASSVISSTVRFDTAQTLTTGQKSQARSNIGLDQVENTADADKPVSTAQAAAIAARFVIDTEDRSINVLQQSDGSAYGKITNPNDVGYDVILLAGQSNSVGANSDIDLTYIDVANDRIKQYAASGNYPNQVITGVDPLFHHIASSAVGHGVAFAREYVKTIPINRDVLLVPCSHGGTGFTTSSLSDPPSGYHGNAGGSWDPAAGSGGVDLYGFAIAQATAALALNTKNRIVAVLWLQGESDANGAVALSQSEYAAKLDTLIAGFRAAIPGASNVPFIVGQMVPEGVGGDTLVDARDVINAAHVDTPKRVLRTAFAYGPLGYGTGTAGSPNTHYTAQGQRLIAVAMHQAFGRARLNVLGAAPIVPADLTLTQSGFSVLLSWSLPSGRYTGWAVEYKINSGDWTTLSTPTVDNTATVAGASAGDVVSARVATINEQGTSAPCSVVSLTLVAVPGQVTGLAAGTVTAASIPLSWTATAGATSYLVEYKSHISGTWLTFGSVTTPSTTLSGLLISTSYDARVSAVNAAGTGAVSSTVTASTTELTPLLDDIAVSAFSAYSTRKLRAAFAGYALRVRRSSDNTEQDIGFVGSELDTDSLLTFAGVGSAYVKTWYDQSGNARDFTQSTTTQQPRIVNAGELDLSGSKPAIVFDGVDDGFIDTNVSNVGIYTAGAATLGAVATWAFPAGAGRPIYAEGGSGQVQIYNLLGITAVGGASTVIKSDDGTSLVASSDNSQVVTGLHARWATDSGSSIHRITDAVDPGAVSYAVARASKTVTLTRRGIGCFFTSSFLAANVNEVVMFTSVLSSSQITTGQTNQKSYYGTP